MIADVEEKCLMNDLVDEVVEVRSEMKERKLDRENISKYYRPKGSCRTCQYLECTTGALHFTFTSLLPSVVDNWRS